MTEQPGVTVETIRFKFLDVDDKKHPERSGRYVPLPTMLAFTEALRDEPDGMEQIISALVRVEQA